MSDAQIQQRIVDLAVMIKATVILVQYRPFDQTWCVLADKGLVMRVVPGTVSSSLSESVTAAEQRWQDRSEERPFV